MENVWFKNSRGLNLEGVFYPAGSNKAIIIAHGFSSNKDREHFLKIADSLNNAEFAVLRFDFSGCGESDDDSISVEKEVDDLKSAIEFVKKKGYGNIGLLGVSLGGLIALRAFGKSTKALVLWAPVTDKKRPSAEKEIVKANENVRMKDNEFLVYKKDGKEFKIGKNYFEERDSVDRKKLLSGINCPVLIIHGDQDQTIPLESSKTAIKKLPKGSKLEIIRGADHKFSEYADEVIRLSVKWFKEHF